MAVATPKECVCSIGGGSDPSVLRTKMEGLDWRDRDLERTCMSLYGHKSLAMIKVVDLGIRTGVLEWSQCIRLVADIMVNRSVRRRGYAVATYMSV